MCKKKVSIIIPTYNRANTIKRAIDSVLVQTYKEFELFVVDDGSTDDTDQIVNSYEDPRVHYLRTEQRNGANHARNIGIQNASGEYIAFQDSDDVWVKDKLEKQMNVFRTQDNVDIVFSRFIRNFLGGEKKLIPNKNFTQEMLNKDIAYILSRRNVISTQTMIVRRQCFLQYGFFDEEMPRFQDWEINIRFSQKSNFICVDEALVEVYESENNITNTNKNDFMGLALLVKKHTDFFRLYGTLTYHFGTLFPIAVKENKVSELAVCLGKELFYESVYAYAYKNINIQINYAFMQKWIMDDCERKVNAFFEQYQAENIIIYGFGDIGKLLINKLVNENKTKIKFLIDQNVSQSAEYEIKRLKDVSKPDFIGVKCLVITAIAHEREIRASLQNIVMDGIFVCSLQDIVNREC